MYRTAARLIPLVALWPITAAAQQAPEIAVRLAPAAPDAAQHIPYVDVTLTVQDMHRKAGEHLAELSLVDNTVVTSAKDLQQLAFSDAQGSFTPQVTDVTQDGSNRLRTWQAPRAIDGTVTIHYRVPIDAAAPPLALPQYEIRTEQGIFSAAGNAFLILPSDETKRYAHVSWDLSASGTGAAGASSFGIGDVTSHEALPAQKLAGAYYMGGQPGHFGPAADGFFASWQGNPAFPIEPLMEWAGKLHRFYGSFFGYTPPSFGVFARTNTLNPGSGIGLTDSFAFTFNQTSKSEEMRSLLAHEMLHSWVNSLDGTMDQAGGLGLSWFGEGLAVYYQRTLPYRAGMMSKDDFLADLNDTAARYYTNIKIGVPNSQIADGFWKDTRIRVLPYDRGSLYFACVDAAIRAASGGKHSLDDIVRTMLATRRAGKPMNEALYRSLLKAELGDKGIAQLDAMLAGGTMLPPSNAFGPEFRRTTKMLRRFDLGFDPLTTLARPRIVKGLVPGSNAEKAGLRDGDEILHSFPQDKLQGEQDAWLTLDVKRDGQTLQIRYQPRGELVQAYQWEKVAKR